MGMTADDAGMDAPTEHLVAVRRTMLVLEMLADAGAGMSLSDIAKELKVNKSIASRIVLTLSDMNYIYRNSENRRFYVGFKICNVGFRILGRAGLADQCEPVLSRLAEQTGELVLFAVFDSGTPRWVMAVTGPRRQLQVVPMTPIEPHSTATGKAWLAMLPDEVIAHVLKGRMRALTPYTITDLDQMMRQIHEIRTTGFAFSNQENEVGSPPSLLPSGEKRRESQSVSASSASQPRFTGRHRRTSFAIAICSRTRHACWVTRGRFPSPPAFPRM
jgi:IclR family acetate operon transcriptional repressor